VLKWWQFQVQIELHAVLQSQSDFAKAGSS